MSQLEKALRTLRWLPAWGWQRLLRRGTVGRRPHLLVALADHFEPSIVPEAPDTFASRDEQERRVERWCREYPRLVDPWRDADGCSFRHTYFYPAEQDDKALVDQIALHCQEGWGELEIHLHHGVDRPDTAAETRRVLVQFRDALAARGCLSRWDGAGPPRYAFVHGNWALANSAGGANCGVDDEMQILAETGCYADMTLPSAPNRAQVQKINALYECALPLSGPAPHRRGRDLTVGRAPAVFPLIVEGPLGLDLSGRPRIENSAVSARRPATLARLGLWQRAAITVAGRPDWVFIKLHCHGMDPVDDAAMLGEPMRAFLEAVTDPAQNGGATVHFLTAREMVNVILAACDGKSGAPGDYRDYRLRPGPPVNRARTA
jgi:hypothetical protein